MAKTYNVYSTSSNNTTYGVYLPSAGEGAPRAMGEKVTIKGGANVSDSKLMTPMGVLTKVTEKQMDVLNNSDAFKRHMKAGFIKVLDAPDDVEKVVGDMEKRDKSSPLTPDDYEVDKVPETGKPTKK